MAASAVALSDADDRAPPGCRAEGVSACGRGRGNRGTGPVRMCSENNPGGRSGGPRYQRKPRAVPARVLDVDYADSRRRSLGGRPPFGRRSFSASLKAVQSVSLNRRTALPHCTQ